MNSPKVSVVVAVRDGESSLQSALASLQNQTLQAIEILVVDDDSRDGTPDLLYQIAYSDTRIRPIRLTRNLGVYRARLVGIQAALSPWIAFLDADDFALPTMFERLLSSAESTQSDIAICGSMRVTPDGRSLGAKIRFPTQQIWNNLIFQDFCQLRFGTGALWNKLYRADLINTWGTRDHRWQQNGTEDTLVNIGCFWAASRVVTLPDLLHHYVDQPGSLTSEMNPELGFSKIFKAFAIAVDLYSHLGPKAIAGIVDLYRVQLAYPSYALPWQTDLPMLSEAVAEPLAFLAQEHPDALMLLLARLPAAPKSGIRHWTMRWLRSLKAHCYG